jgi:hypothetical protein
MILTILHTEAANDECYGYCVADGEDWPCSFVQACTPPGVVMVQVAEIGDFTPFQLVDWEAL